MFIETLRTLFRPREPEGPEVTQAELDEFKKWHASTELPCAHIIVGDRPPNHDLRSCIGGRPWLARGTKWPMDMHDEPQNFIAQINFSEMPAIHDFPDRGLMLFFIASHGGHGTSEDHLPGDTAVIFYENPVLEAGALHSHPAIQWGRKRNKRFPFLSQNVFEHGRSISFQAGQTRASLADWQMERWDDRFQSRGGREYEHLIDAIAEGEEQLGHYIGGHAQFTQNDIRDHATLREFDRILLKLGFDDAIMFGDAGEANFMIRQGDLLNRNFSNYLFTWDCC